MSQPCLRCGFPNDAKSLHCRACSAPLQEKDGETVIKPRLRQILAETRARTRARQRRGTAVDPNRVDVVPRLPSGVAASETALKAALEKGRQARLQGLREELRKGRPSPPPPTSQSVPPQEPGATQPPSAEELAARERAEQAAKEKAAAEQAAARAAEEKAAAEQAAAKAAAEKAKAEQIAAKAAAKKAKAEQAAAKAAAETAAAEQAAAKAAAAKAAEEQAAAKAAAQKAAAERAAAAAAESAATEAAAATYLDDRSAAPSPAKKPSVLDGAAAESAIKADLEPRVALPVAEAFAREESGATPTAQSDNMSAFRRVGSELAPALREAAQQALGRLRAAALRLQVDGDQTKAEPEEQRCALFDGRRLLVALIDAAPALFVAALWLGTEFSGAALPPEEVVASWVLGESGALPFGLVVSCLVWLAWSWGGIALWRASPGMKAMGLSWSEAPTWRIYARPPLFLVSLLPLGLGGTYALIDRNSRGLSDLLLSLRWLHR